METLGRSTDKAIVLKLVEDSLEQYETIAILRLPPWRKSWVVYGTDREVKVVEGRKIEACGFLQYKEGGE